MGKAIVSTIVPGPGRFLGWLCLDLLALCLHPSRKPRATWLFGLVDAMPAFIY